MALVQLLTEFRGVWASVPSADTTTPSDGTTTPGLPDAGDVVTATVDTLAIVFSTVLGLVIGLVISFIIQGMLRFVVRRHPKARTTIQSIALPLKVSFGLAGAWIGMYIGWDVPEGDAEPWLRGALHHGFLVAVILAATWFAAAFFDGVESTILEGMYQSGQARYRKVQTQLQILHRIVIVIIWVLGFGLVLMTFPSARTLGTTLFTSAGLLSVVLGIAAQSTLGNVFAGLQLAFSDSIRMGDIVIWQKEFTSVEEITLTYVVLKVWDGRRLIVPSSQMTSTTFENWTRRTPDLLGYVDFDLDWSAPITHMRDELNAILAQTSLWDGDTGILQVRDATSSKLQVSILISAENASKLTDLKYYVREHMVRWIQENAPQAVPHSRSWAGEEPKQLGDFSMPEAEGLASAGNEEKVHTTGAVAGDHVHDDRRLSSLSSRPPANSGQQHAVKAQTPAAESTPSRWKGTSRGLKHGRNKAKKKQTSADMAETAVMSLADIEAEFPVRVSVKERDFDVSEGHTQEAGHESSIFTGSRQAEKRAQEFSGPGEDVLREREISLEKQKANEVAKDVPPADTAEEERSRKDKSATQKRPKGVAETAIMGALQDE